MKRWVCVSVWTGLFWVSCGVGGVRGGAFTHQRSDLWQEWEDGFTGLRGLQKTPVLHRFGLEFPSSPPSSVPSWCLRRHRHLQLRRARRLSEWHGTRAISSVTEMRNLSGIWLFCSCVQESLSDVMERAPVGLHLAFVGYSYTATRLVTLHQQLYCWVQL